MFNFGDLSVLKSDWENAEPFPHLVIDNFIDSELALKAASEFPNFNDDFWYDYDNPLEIKKACSDWNKFPSSIYKIFFNLLSNDVANKLSFLTNKKLYPDFGLHGGGLHCHKSGGKLNSHLDYSIHPKLTLQRKVNIIIYITENWKSEWNGSLGLWSHDENTNQPKNLVKKVDCVFNRAVIFDTTMNSWHGLPDPVKCPESTSRNSLATYYLCEPNENADTRLKVLYAPTEEQKGNDIIADLIKKRSSSEHFKEVYRIK